MAAFAEKVHDESISAADRERVIDAIGEEGLVDAAAICANFNMMVRIADGTGTPLDAGSADMTGELRTKLELDDLVSRRFDKTA